ncbi:hypothetical protein MACH16_15830 [Marinomonas pontica]|uniref:Uncharacterized protein n=1 Tax=Marinomonas pontica TaxID=264739 RepID=A0ABM8FCM7_9GAMM|nr:hypothetical protein MACH16_15830 [Marinomonas pontica]
MSEICVDNKKVVSNLSEISSSLNVSDENSQDSTASLNDWVNTDAICFAHLENEVDGDDNFSKKKDWLIIKFIKAINTWSFAITFGLASGLVIGIYQTLVRLVPLILIGGVIFWFATSDSREKNKVINSFDGFVENSIRSRIDVSTLPVVAGRVLPVDLSESKVDKNIYFALSDELRPKTVEEVSLILGINCQGQVIGTYTDGRKGLQQHCDVHLINPKTLEWTFLGEFVGSEPPETKKDSGDKSGSRSTREILNKFNSIISSRISSN